MSTEHLQILLSVILAVIVIAVLAAALIRAWPSSSRQSAISAHGAPGRPYRTSNCSPRYAGTRHWMSGWQCCPH